MVQMQAGAVLAGMYMSRAQAQLQAQETRKSRKKGKRKMGDGKAKYFTGDKFFQLAVDDTRERDEEEAGKEQRKTQHEAHAVELAAWNMPFQMHFYYSPPFFAFSPTFMVKFAIFPTTLFTFEAQNKVGSFMFFPYFYCLTYNFTNFCSQLHQLFQFENFPTIFGVNFFSLLRREPKPVK
jgi:hypothetical protein